MFADSCRAGLIHTSWAAVLFKYCFIPKSERSSAPKAMRSQACICKKWERSTQEQELNLLLFHCSIVSLVSQLTALTSTEITLTAFFWLCNHTFNRFLKVKWMLGCWFQIFNMPSIISKTPGPMEPKFCVLMATQRSFQRGDPHTST